MINIWCKDKLGYASLEQVVDAVDRLDYVDKQRRLLRRTTGLWHVLIFLRCLRLRDQAASPSLGAFDLAEAAFDLNGVLLPVLSNSRNVYFEPAAKQGNAPDRFFRHREGPRQTYLNRIYTGLVGGGPNQPRLFKADGATLPVTLELASDWIDVLRGSEANCEVLDDLLRDLLTWVFRFGVPTRDGKTAGIAEHQGNGLLVKSPGVELTPLPLDSIALQRLVEDFFGLTTAQSERLFPRIADIQTAIWSSSNPLPIGDLAPELSTRLGLTPVLSVPGESAPTKIEVPDRIRRMVRLAIASYKAVLLVGPPGTGKTALLREMVDEAIGAPAKFGLSGPPSAPKWVTPDESWTTRDLVGGESIDDHGKVKFRTGYLLDAIEENRWLVLDEANRADLDKIFGPLLTWLGSSHVELGRVSREPGAPPIVLAWNDEPKCAVVGSRSMLNDSSNETVKFLAGRDWRLLGTYNALDAQKVFRFGQALARRFAEIPIPLPSPDDFNAVLAASTQSMPGIVFDSLSRLYRAHFSEPNAELGPAIILKCLPYIQKAIEVGEIAPSDGARSDLDSSAIGAAPDELIFPLISEAYVAAAGKYLARLEESELNRLGQEIVADGALPETEWEWIKELLPDLP